MEVSLSGGGSASSLTITNEFNLFSENTLLKGMKSFRFDPINDKLVEKKIKEKSLWDYICDGASYIGDKVGDFVDSVAGHVVAGLCVVATITAGVFYVASVFASGGATLAFLPEMLALGTFTFGTLGVINKGLSDAANNQVSSYSDYLFEGVMGSAKGLLTAESFAFFGGLGIQGLDLAATSSFFSGGLNNLLDQGVRTGTVDFEKVAEAAIFESIVGALTFGAIEGAGAVASAFKGAAGKVTGAKGATGAADGVGDDIANAADDAVKGASKTGLPTETELNEAVSEWSSMQKSLASSNRQASKFNTGTVVYDASTGQYYYGMNRGVQISGDTLNPTLSKMLPEKSLNAYKLGNCAEVDAVNQALNSGANMKDLYMYTVNVNTGVAKGMCENCSYTFNGNVASVLSK